MSSLECKVYVRELRPLGYGLPLFEPNPAGYDHVRVGDVGIANRDGYFMRIFNCFAQADHEINARYGVPESFEPLEVRRPLTSSRQALEPGHWYKSHHIHQIQGSVDFSASNSPVGMRANFSASNQQGAAFYLKHRAERTDATRLISFRRYMLKHFESWEQFIRSMDFQFELQDIVFVTGHDLTANWATATRVHRNSVGSLAVTFSSVMATVAASLSRSSESFFEIPVRIGPNPYNPSERHYLLEGDTPSPGTAEPFKDQCIFLRGYRVAKRPILPAKLRAAAGPGNLDMDGDDDTYADVVPIGFDPDEENHIDEHVVDHNFAMDLVFKHTNAEIAIINESDVCILAKAVGNDAKQPLLQNREVLRAIGLEIKAEFDSRVQKSVGTLKMSPLATVAPSSTSWTAPSYEVSVEDGKPKKQHVEDSELDYKDDKFINPRTSKGKRKEVSSVPNAEKQMKESTSFSSSISFGSELTAGQVRGAVKILPSKTLNGHNFAVCAVAFSPDGSRIMSGSGDRTVRLWDAVTGVQIGEPLRGYDGEVRSVAFSPDGSRIASGFADGTIRLWDAVTGMQVGGPLCGHEGWVGSVAFSSDGSRIASGSLDRTIRHWDAATGMQVGDALRGHGDWVLSVAFSPGRRRIASGSEDKTIRLWDAVTGMQVGEPLRGHDSPVYSVAFSPDGSRIASGSEDGTIRLWDVARGMQVGQPLLGHDGLVESVAFSPDGSHIASGSWDNTIRLWDAVTGIQVGKHLRGHNEGVSSVAFSPDGKHVVSGSYDKTVRIWEIVKTLPSSLQQFIVKAASEYS